MGYNAKTVIRMFRNEDGEVCAHVEKDRTHVHEDNSIIVDPTLIDWQKVIDKTANNKAFVVKNDLVKSVEVEQKLYEREVLGSVGDPIKDCATNQPTHPDELDVIRAEIKAKIGALSPVAKKEFREILEKEGLPTAFAKETNIDVLKKVLAKF